MRLGVPWYRVQPRKGEFDWSYMDQVMEFTVDTCGLEPIIDLVHYGTPGWMRRSFLNPRYPQYVEEYGEAFARHYGRMARYYTPNNEPRIAALYGGPRNEWPPHAGDWPGYVQILLAIAQGIQRTMKVVRGVNPDAVFITAEAIQHWNPIEAGAVEEAR